MKLFVLLFLMSMVCVSCTQQVAKYKAVDISTSEVIYSDAVERIKIDETKIRSVNITDKLDSVRYIPLETNSQSIMGSISKIIYHKGYFYILDSQSTNSIFIFNNEGRFVEKISRKGRGPGEYSKISDFCIDRTNDQIVIFADMPIKIIRYSIGGKFISEIKPPCYSYRFALLPDKAYAIYLDYCKNTRFQMKEHNLIVVDSTARIKEGFLQYNSQMVSKYFYKSAKNFYTFKDEVYLYPTLKDTIFKVCSNGIMPVYSFDFGKNAFNNAILQENTSMQEKYYSKLRYASINEIFETDNVLFFSFSLNGLVQSGYYSKLTSKLMIFPYCDSEKYIFGKTIGSSDKFLINQIDQMRIIHYQKYISKLPSEFDKHFLEIVKNYKETDNPVLVIFKMVF